MIKLEQIKQMFGRWGMMLRAKFGKEGKIFQAKMKALTDTIGPDSHAFVTWNNQNQLEVVGFRFYNVHDGERIDFYDETGVRRSSDIFAKGTTLKFAKNRMCWHFATKFNAVILCFSK